MFAIRVRVIDNFVDFLIWVLTVDHLEHMLLEMIDIRVISSNRLIISGSPITGLNTKLALAWVLKNVSFFALSL